MEYRCLNLSVGPLETALKLLACYTRVFVETTRVTCYLMLSFSEWSASLQACHCLS